MIDEERSTEDTPVEDGSVMEDVTDGQQQHAPQTEKVQVRFTRSHNHIFHFTELL